MVPYRIFISAVSNELGQYRREVARVLRRKGLEVRDQEHFSQGPATLIERLSDYIQQCEAVVLLVGERCGVFPSDTHAAALGAIPIFDQYRAATGQSRASYTQWEFMLAKHHGRKTYVFLTDAGFRPDDSDTEAADLPACQQAYRAWIKEVGEHRDALTTPAKLVEDVLVLPFPDLGRPKPIALPYRSLGTFFKGREGFLAELRESLKHAVNGHATAIVGKALHGLGGVGKTRLAVEYAWQHETDYSALLFVVADSPENLRRNLAALVGPLVLDLPEQGGDQRGGARGCGPALAARAPRLVPDPRQHRHRGGRHGRRGVARPIARRIGAHDEPARTVERQCRTAGARRSRARGCGTVPLGAQRAGAPQARERCG